MNTEKALDQEIDDALLEYLGHIAQFRVLNAELSSHMKSVR